jgi:hypothetical protein
LKGWLVVLACLAANTPLQALETDQFYAWGKPIEDSGDYLNAWVKWQAQTALESRKDSGSLDCEGAVRHVHKYLQDMVYQPIEVWIFSSKLVDRIPQGLEEEREYRKHWVLSNTFPMDYARWLPPSPTLQVNEIRFGSDKLAHFFSEGWWYYRWWLKRGDNLSQEEVQRGLFEYGSQMEWWFLGKMVTGVISPADLESNYQGFVFYHQMCHGDEPLLSRQQGHWRFSETFDFRDYISPEWDETWNPNVYDSLRWKNIKRTIEGYCPQLNTPWVQQQRARYREMNTQTVTEALIQEQVAAGEMPAQKTFDITTVCNGQTEMGPGIPGPSQ